jgi:CrcB protein
MRSSHSSHHGSIPWGTFAVNVSGSFLLGFLFTLLVHRFDIPMWLQSATLVGVLGGYTTFSTMSLELFLLVERHEILTAFGYAAGSITSGVAAIFIGIHLARAIT